MNRYFGIFLLRHCCIIGGKGKWIFNKSILCNCACTRDYLVFYSVALDQVKAVGFLITVSDSQVLWGGGGVAISATTS